MKKTQKILIVILALVLTFAVFAACGKKSGGGVPASPDKAKSNLESNGYTVVELSAEEASIHLAIFGCTSADVDSMIIARSGEDLIYIVFAKSANVAKERYNAMKIILDEYQDMKKHGVSGKVIYLGTEDAYKAMCKAATSGGGSGGSGSSSGGFPTLSKAKSNLQANGYYVQEMSSSAYSEMASMFGCKASDIKGLIEAVSDNDAYGICIGYFSSASVAKNALDAFKMMMGGDSATMISGASGNVCYVGTQAAYSAALGK